VGEKAYQFSAKKRNPHYFKMWRKDQRPLRERGRENWDRRKKRKEKGKELALQIKGGKKKKKTSSLRVGVLKRGKKEEGHSTREKGEGDQSPVDRAIQTTACPFSNGKKPGYKKKRAQTPRGYLLKDGERVQKRKKGAVLNPACWDWKGKVSPPLLRGS